MAKPKLGTNAINAKTVAARKSYNWMKNIVPRARNSWRKLIRSAITPVPLDAFLALAIAPCSTGSKKAQTLPPLKTTLAEGQAQDQLEVDELFTFVQVKAQQRRIWIIQCRRTRQILAFFIGDGSAASCRRLWRKLPTSYQRCVSYSDFWRAYSCLPTATHQMVGKETGQTAHIERLNNTLRQRLSRLVRKTLSFSKREYMLNLHFKLFAYFYNLEHRTT
jgi:IS1 family transposase